MITPSISKAAAELKLELELDLVSVMELPNHQEKTPFENPSSAIHAVEDGVVEEI